MDALADPAELEHALIAALDAEDHDAAAALLARHDQAVRDFAIDAGARAYGRDQLIALQRLQLRLIELVRGRRDSIGEQLHTLAQGAKASRAYLSEGSE